MESGPVALGESIDHSDVAPFAAGGEIDDGDGARLEFSGDELAQAAITTRCGVIADGGVADADQLQRTVLVSAARVENRRSMANTKQSKTNAG